MNDDTPHEAFHLYEVRERANRLRRVLDQLSAEVGCAVDAHNLLAQDVVLLSSQTGLTGLDWDALCSALEVDDLVAVGASLADIHLSTTAALGT